MKSFFRSVSGLVLSLLPLIGPKALAAPDGEAVPRDVRMAAAFVARSLEDRLARTSFQDPREFVRNFTLERHLRVPNVNETHREVARRHFLQLAARVYFIRLRQNLPRFFEKRPTAAEIRWVLETPLQFPVSVIQDPAPLGHPRRPGDDPPWMALPGGHSEKATATEVHELLYSVLSGALPPTETIADWLEIATFQVPDESYYRELRVWAVNYHLDSAIRLGDDRLDWMESVVIDVPEVLHASPQPTWFQMLYELRNSLSKEGRTPRNLSDQAVDWILTGPHGARVMDSDALKDWKKGLFGYLAARSGRGHVVGLEAERLQKLAEASVGTGFRLSPILEKGGRHYVRIEMEKRTLGKWLVEKFCERFLKSP